MYTCQCEGCPRAEYWCPVKGGGCILEVSFERGFTVHNVVIVKYMCRIIRWNTIT